MASRSQRVHVVTTSRRYKGRIYRTHLLRHSYRENGRVKNETVGNLSHLPEPVIEFIRKALQGEVLVPVTGAFEILSSSPQGHVQAVLTAMRATTRPIPTRSAPDGQARFSDCYRPQTCCSGDGECRHDSPKGARGECACRCSDRSNRYPTQSTCRTTPRCY